MRVTRGGLQNVVLSASFLLFSNRAPLLCWNFHAVASQPSGSRGRAGYPCQAFVFCRRPVRALSCHRNTIPRRQPRPWRHSSSPCFGNRFPSSSDSAAASLPASHRQTESKLILSFPILFTPRALAASRHPSPLLLRYTVMGDFLVWKALKGTNYTNLLVPVIDGQQRSALIAALPGIQAYFRVPLTKLTIPTIRLKANIETGLEQTPSADRIVDNKKFARSFCVLSSAFKFRASFSFPMLPAGQWRLHPCKVPVLAASFHALVSC